MSSDALQRKKEYVISKVTFNDETFETVVGENLLALARRRGLHVWFFCDGRGLCQTCQCRVLAGAENLSPPNDIEVAAISESHRRNGFRLACQTRLSRPGDVALLSLAELLRREAAEFLTFQRGAARTATDLLKDFAGFASDVVGSLPSIAQKAIPQLIDTPPSLGGIYDYLRDGQHVIMRVLANPLSTRKKQ